MKFFFSRNSYHQNPFKKKRKKTQFSWENVEESRRRNYPIYSFENHDSPSKSPFWERPCEDDNEGWEESGCVFISVSERWNANESCIDGDKDSNPNYKPTKKRKIKRFVHWSERELLWTRSMLAQSSGIGINVACLGGFRFKTCSCHHMPNKLPDER